MICRTRLNKSYCNLTKEQASIYEAVVKDVTEEIDLLKVSNARVHYSTLMKLKQVCNHPKYKMVSSPSDPSSQTQPLDGDGRGSDRRRRKLQHQFKEIGDALEKYLKQTCRYNTYYINGTSRIKREQWLRVSKPRNWTLGIYPLTQSWRSRHYPHQLITCSTLIAGGTQQWKIRRQTGFSYRSEENVFVHKFVAIGTLEERIDQMISDKKKAICCRCWFRWVLAYRTW